MIFCFLRSSIELGFTTARSSKVTKWEKAQFEHKETKLILDKDSWQVDRVYMGLPPLGTANFRTSLRDILARILACHVAFQAVSKTFSWGYSPGYCRIVSDPFTLSVSWVGRAQIAEGAVVLIEPL